MKFIVAVVMLAVALGAEAYSATSFLNGPHLGAAGYNGGFYGGYPGYYGGYGASGYYGSSGHYGGYGAHYGLPSAVAVHSAPVFGSHAVHNPLAYASYGSHAVHTPAAYASYGSHAVHAPAVVASHGSHAVHASTALAAVGAHGSTYVAKTRGSEHVAPLPGHVHSVASVNVHPAPGTW